MRTVLYSPNYKPVTLDDDSLCKKMIDSGEWFESPFELGAKNKKGGLSEFRAKKSPKNVKLGKINANS